ncbi:MAG: hypothetical protein ABR961_01985 [Thermoanaerobaculaceae bacterium]
MDANPNVESVVSDRTQRRKLLEELQELRDGHLVVAYVTSTRPGHEIQLGDDILRFLFDHLESNKERAKKGIDLFLHSHGGSGTAPWRIVSLIREYTKKFAVLVPHRAFSAGTLLAMGANQIVMHRMGCLGPIDPSVTNIFNPPHPASPGQLAPINVEDVSAYMTLVKEEVGITHEDELVQAFLALTEQIHPLALGNVQRSHRQARMMARKLLETHMSAKDQQHEIDDIIDKLKSKLFYHGHPINRLEAKKDLGLKVVFAPEALEQVMWKLYLEYERALSIKESFNPVHELEIRGKGTPQPALTTEVILQQMAQMAKLGLGLGTPNITEEQLVRLAAAMVRCIGDGGEAAKKAAIDDIPGAFLESDRLSHVLKTNVTIERATITTKSGPQDAVKQEIRWQRWEEEP